MPTGQHPIGNMFAGSIAGVEVPLGAEHHLIGVLILDGVGTRRAGALGSLEVCSSSLESSEDVRPSQVDTKDEACSRRPLGPDAAHEEAPIRIARPGQKV